MPQRPRASCWLPGLAAAGLAACTGLAPLVAPPTPTPAIPTPIPTTAIPTVPPTPTIPPDWSSVAPGVELRALPILAEGKSDAAEAVLLRIDPTHAAVKILYDKDTPARVGEWQARLGALAVINAGFFQEDYTSAGLLVVDGGERYGLTFVGSPDYGEGMFSIVAGAMYIRALAAQPYDPTETLEQAVQGLPMLVDGGAPVDFELPDRVARRTAVALDADGRLLLIHVYSGQITLPRLRDWLASLPELGAVSALNLDGGPSTGMVISGGPWPVNNDSVTRVPSIIAVTAR